MPNIMQRTQFVRSLINNPFVLTINDQDMMVTFTDISGGDDVWILTMLVNDTTVSIVADIMSPDFKNMSSVVHWLVDELATI